MKSKNALLLLSLLFIFDRFCLHITGFDEYEPESTHHRTRRSVYALSDIPQPSAEYPIVVFSD
ncbi:hypothetical protein OS493_009138 [Desmophyllum pertusum]|uniref:Uncharacterized protein n=1 Tax=Desmophyllum pertusum TaxID=174260 RepID=A0A9W9Z257_9CNID|nr:hypothetical protein OS493_009138 [Desmophyllum pertusum]